MTTGLLLVLTSTLAGGFAVAVAASAFEAGPVVSAAARSGRDNRATPICSGVVAALIVAALTGWLFPALVIGAATGLGVRIVRPGDRATGQTDRTEALASWIENLRDVLIAGDQPIGAINATVATCPPQIRPQVRRLAAGLGRQDPEVVFRRFADELDDPLGDLVAAGLLIAVQRGARTVAVLTALAEQARQQSDRRRLVEAERAPIKREVNVLTAIMATLLAALFVFGRADYLSAYDSSDGQLFLGSVLAIYAGLLFRVRQLGRYPRPSRFLTGGVPSSGPVREMSR